MKNIFIFASLFLCLACSKYSEKASCIDDKIAAASTALKDVKAVEEYIYEGNQVFLLISEASAWDGPSYILTADCDTLCQYGGKSINSTKCNGKEFAGNATFVKRLWEK